MNKLLMYLMSFILLFTISCDSDDTIVGGGIIDEPDLVGCEATQFYDWSDYEFSSSLDAGATIWLGFELEETTLNCSSERPGSRILQPPASVTRERPAAISQMKILFSFSCDDSFLSYI